jgi:hypothetical protein
MKKRWKPTGHYQTVTPYPDPAPPPHYVLLLKLQRRISHPMIPSGGAVSSYLLNSAVAHAAQAHLSQFLLNRRLLAAPLLHRVEAASLSSSHCNQKFAPLVFTKASTFRQPARRPDTTNAGFRQSFADNRSHAKFFAQTLGADVRGKRTHTPPATFVASSCL